MGGSLSAEQIVVKVPSESADNEQLARVRAVYFAQFGAHMTTPEVVRVQRTESCWRVQLRESTEAR